MKFSNVPLLFILIVIFMIFSGCISTPPLKETSLNPIGTLVHGYDLFDNTEFGWYYYQINTKSITNGLWKVDMKANISREVYNGTPAIHYVFENTFEKLDTNEITYLSSDVYLDENLKTLGGYAKGSKNGKEENVTITPEINPTKIDGFWWTLERPFFKNSSGYVFKGSDPVTVGAGSFPNALHYTSVDYMGEWDYWIAPGVPLFVKATLHSPEVEMNIDLIGWGDLSVSPSAQPATPTPTLETKLSTLEPSEMALQLSDLPEGYVKVYSSSFIDIPNATKQFTIKFQKGTSSNTEINQVILVFPIDQINSTISYIRSNALKISTTKQLSNPNIGDSSFAIKAVNALEGGDIYIIYFVKKDVFEVLEMEGSVTDYETLKQLATIAAAKIK